MNVNNLIMNHYHMNGVHDELWQVGNELTIDNSFTSNFCTILDSFSTKIDISNGDSTSLDKIIKYYRDNKDKITFDVGMSLLEDSYRIINGIIILNRERALEEYRKLYYPDLPSRLHSIWLSDKDSLDFWKMELNENSTLFELCVSGNIFKSSDWFIPKDQLSVLEMYENAKYYWNPNFDSVQDEKRNEYLFQGNIKILKKY